MTDYKCPICRSEQTEVYWHEVWKDPGRVVRRCCDCDLLFLFPQKSAEEQLDFDRHYDDYIHAREEWVLNDSTDHFDELVDESIRERYRDIEGLLPGENRGLSLLEIGAEKGTFLDLVKPHFAISTAVDACPAYRDLLRRKGYPSYLYVTEIEPSETFDLICFFSLLEHILEPHAFLRELKSRLKTDGRILFEVPSAEDPLLSLYHVEAFKSFYFQSMHPYVYHQKTLELLFNACGLEIVHIQYKQRYGLDNHLHWLQKGLPRGNPELADFFADSTLVEGYLRYLESKGKTDTIYAVARHRGC
ncbi:MAG: class I SAM-dependent methyltransferase [Planctomycetes bacterium]|nr:class I SAM-dependent methyltransferase [Planctomycetota bacterium]